MKTIAFILIWCSSQCACQIEDSRSNYNSSEDTYEPVALFDDVSYPRFGDIPVLNRKIFKGLRVSIMEHPYVVSIRRQYAHFLTGTLLSKNLIITVANPLINVPIYELGVVVGENYSDRGSSMLTVVLVIIHENFNPYNLKADLALLKVFEDLLFKTTIKPIGLISPNNSLKDSKGFVTGWGRCDITGNELCLHRTSIYYPNEKIDPMLRTVKFTINLPNYYCEGYKRHGIKLRTGMLCLGTAREEDAVAPCMAVPGAPLVVTGLLAGMQSWGFGCGYVYDLPLVYTDIKVYHSWILHNTHVMRNISVLELTDTYRATKAYLMSQWLIQTRETAPLLHKLNDVEIQVSILDTKLAALKGIVYDIRDFAYESRYHTMKSNMYKAVRSQLKRLKKINIINKLYTLRKGEPFLSNETMNKLAEMNTNALSEVIYSDTKNDINTDNGSGITKEVSDDENNDDNYKRI